MIDEYFYLFCLVNFVPIIQQAFPKSDQTTSLTSLLVEVIFCSQLYCYTLNDWLKYKLATERRFFYLKGEYKTSVSKNTQPKIMVNNLSSFDLFTP